MIPTNRCTATVASVVAATALVCSIPVASADDDFPNKPIRFVTPYPPGGSHSLHAGVITTVAEEYFGQPMISVIRGGGGGVVGATEVARSDPDGYTILFGDPTINTLRPQVEDLPYSIDDFIPVARINYSPAVFVAASDGPFTTMDEMVAYAGDNPDELIHSSDNVNGFTDTVFKLLEARTDTQMRAIEFGGGGPAITQLVGGNTMAYAGAPSVVGEHVESGDLVALCVTDTQRWSTMEEVPTCQELGYDVVFQFWRGALVPKDTPPEIVQQLSDSFAELVKDEGFLRLISNINSRVDFAGHEEFATLFENEIEAMAQIAAEAE